MFSTVIMTILLSASVNCLYFGVSDEHFCFEIEYDKGKTIKFFYYVSGDDPEATEAHLISSNINIPQILLYGYSNQTYISADALITVCFVTKDKTYKSVSIDFYTHEKAHLMYLAKKSEIYELHSKLIDVGESLKYITTNEQFEYQRQIIHSQIITEHEDTIKKFAIAKLLLIIVVAVGQLYLLKKMLDKPRGYQRV